MKSFFFPFFDSIMYYFTCTLFSVSATITERAMTTRCITEYEPQFLTLMFAVCWPITAATTPVKTHRPADLTICYCRVSTIHPAGCSSVTLVGRWTWSWHSCAGWPLKTKPARSDSPVTIRSATVVRNLSGKIVKASVILTFWYIKKKIII